MLSKEKLDFFRSLLTERLERLKAEAERARGDMTRDHENLPDTVDLASHESTRDFNIRIRDRERKLITKIEIALRRIDSGAFGVCVVCEEPIAERRLIARPMTTHCIDCKTAAELMERQRGRI